jgi:DNA-binding HxlR family transcriptional regulator
MNAGVLTAGDGQAAAGRPRACPIAASLGVLGERWTLLAIRELNYGVHRFEEIVRNTGATRDLLAVRLRKLESAGVIEKRQYSEHPPRFEYHLTAAGEELRPVLLSLAQWGQKWVDDAPADTFVHQCGHQLDAAYVCTHCGGPVTRQSLTAVPAGSLSGVSGPALPGR